MSTQCSIITQKINKQGKSQKNACLPPFQNTQEIMSILTPSNNSSSSIFPLSLETCSYSNTLQQKLLATKQKLKRIGTKQKTELKRSTFNKLAKSTNNLPNIKLVKNSINKNNESIMLGPEKLPKSMKELKSNNLELNNFLNPAHVNFNQSVQNSNSPIEIKMLPDKLTNAMSSASKSKSSDNFKFKTIKQGMMTSGVTISKVESSSLSKSKNFPQIPKSVYINLDSAVEQARLKSTILQNNGFENKKTKPVSLTPAMLLSSCPGLSITPIVNTNHKTNYGPNKLSTSCQIQNTTTKTKKCNFEHFGNSVTITKAEKKIIPKSQGPK